MKSYWVTTEKQLNKRTKESKVIGFISVFGWESAKEKAEKKFPGFAVSGLHEFKLRKR